MTGARDIAEAGNCPHAGVENLFLDRSDFRTMNVTVLLLRILAAGYLQIQATVRVNKNVTGFEEMVVRCKVPLNWPVRNSESRRNFSGLKRVFGHVSEIACIGHMPPASIKSHLVGDSVDIRLLWIHYFSSPRAQRNVVW